MFIFQNTKPFLLSTCRQNVAVSDLNKKRIIAFLKLEMEKKGFKEIANALGAL
jgi:hypothetical protein